MPRAIWSGSISFGLINAPVRLYAAVEEQDLHFHLVHEKDGSPIGYQKVCKVEGQPVPDEEIVKAFELEDGQYVPVTAEDFEAAEVEGYKAISILDFVPYEQIDPIYFERTYYLGPEPGSERVYALLARAMSESGLAAIGRFVFREREQLGCLRVREGAITLEKMYFADEIRPLDGLAPDVEVDERELELASELIDRLAGDFKPERYRDLYREKLLAIIERKRKGRKVRPSRRKEPAEAVDLVQALRQSVAQANRGRRAASGSRRRRRAAA
jgi:DNA end-binding protein Ku